ncbi:hypothetical protein A0H76_1860 [Hepatospora eriocheir]|uniref:Tetraspanin n=1 Tax=Hepatospora eriocheir TaxID=1081669 RepID=A0A1X0QGC7_9MICR|nr:hypothetical protein A0H76_1860 [Hepatospora eriocheir]
MIAKNFIRLILKVIYGFIQLFMVLLGIVLIFALWSIYIAIQSPLNLHYKSLQFISSICLILIINGIAGFRTIFKRSKFRVCIYIFTLVALINLQFIQLLKNNEFVEKNYDWTNIKWGLLNDNQRSHLQTAFGCCGFDNPSDRPGSKCVSTEGCVKKFLNVGYNLRKKSNAIIFILYFLESLGLCIISYLKFIRQ